MEIIHSECCKFEIGNIEDSDAYCYVCGKVHSHGHLDLRQLRTTLLGKVVSRHNLDWQEIQKDQKKFGGMKNGIFCQSILTEIQALCSHGKPVFHRNQPLRLHMCYGVRPNDDPDEGEFVSDTSIEQGLDFTSDICGSSDSLGTNPTSDLSPIVMSAEIKAGQFRVGEVLKYNPEMVAFERRA